MWHRLLTALWCVERHTRSPCVTVSVEMSRSVVWSNLWSQDCNISPEWRKTVFHLIPTKLLNSSRLYEPHRSPSEAAPILYIMFIKCIFSWEANWTFISRAENYWIYQHTNSTTFSPNMGNINFLPLFQHFRTPHAVCSQLDAAQYNSAVRRLVF